MEREISSTTWERIRQRQSRSGIEEGAPALDAPDLVMNIHSSVKEVYARTPASSNSHPVNA
jgi:hypothetical protein